MDYESFKEKFVEDVKDRLYEQGAEVDLSIHTVRRSLRLRKQSFRRQKTHRF